MDSMVLKLLRYSTFTTALMLVVLMIVVLIKNRRSRVNLSFAMVCFSAALWLFSYSQAYSSRTLDQIVFWFKIGYPGVVFISITHVHFANAVLRINSTRLWIILNYFSGFLITLLIWKTNLIVNGVNEYAWGHYPKAGLWHPFFLVFFMGLVTSASCQMGYFYFFRKNNEDIGQTRYQQLKYILLAFVIFTFASIDFIPNYGVNILPLGFIAVTIFLLIIFYSIVRYRLMDVSLAITKTSIFVVVYSLVLGAPFAIVFGLKDKLILLFGENWWLIPLMSSTFLATAGPYIYLYIQKRAEDRLLQEQRAYQSTLRQASMGMGRIKDLKKLLQLIVHIVIRAVKLEHCEIYLLHETSNQFVLKASKGKKNNNEFSVIPINSSFIQELKKVQEPIVYDEIKQRSQDYIDANLAEIEKLMAKMDAALVVPSFIEERLIAIIVLGKKRSGKHYSQDDLAVFSILANQSALAIENAQFYEDMKKTHEQLFRAEKMATIGTMADGLSHQINNRLHAMGFIAGDALDTLKINIKDSWPSDVKATIDEVRHALDRIQENIKRGGEVVEGLLKYTRKGEEGFQPVDFDKLVDSAIEMAQFKIKAGEVEIIKNYKATAPIYGNFTQLQEVLFNMIDNSYDAIMQRKNELKEEHFKGAINIYTEPRGKRVEVILKDNGMGVKDEDLTKLFTPFFTTKLSSKKGTGLGLYVIRKIIEENHGGKVEFLSRYKVGSETHLLLPVAGQEDKSN